MAVLTFLKLWAFTEMLILCAGEIKHMQNIALNKACQMSSRYIIAPGRMTGECSAAINGDTNTILDLARSRSNCINTKLDDTSPFWSVDLGQEFSINTISIYGRANYTNRMGCVNVSLDGKVVKRFSNTSVWTNDRYDIKVGHSGRVVNITKDCLADVYSINLCQVQVWVCEDGWYGDNCTQVCGHCAGGSVCDKINGNCTSCQTGFQLPNCTECKDGWYGENCGEVCGHCLRGNTTCDNKIGYCPSCGGAFQPPLCKEKCSAGYYGQNCKQTCGHCRVNTTCDPDNGTCTYGCSGGYKEGLCSECEDGWYGDDCTETCGHCMGGSSTCDKKYGSCSSCDGAFQPPLCKETCQDGWYGKNCLERCGHCVGGISTCDKTSGSCPSCDGSFQPPLCKESVMPSSDKETVSLVGPVAGAAAGCSVIFFIIGGLFVCCIFRKTRSRHSAGAVRSPDEISMTFGSTIATPRSENTPDITSPENTSDPSVNVYDKLHARANDNTAAYSSITLHTDSKDTTTATEYVNITSTANDKNRYKRNQGKVVRQ